MPLPLTGTDVVETGLEQVVSPGSYRRKVMVPVGLSPLPRVAKSKMGDPAGNPEADAWWARIGVAAVAGTVTSTTRTRAMTPARARVTCRSRRARRCCRVGVSSYRRSLLMRGLLT